MKTVVAVLRGGPSSEYEVSLKSGATVLAALDSTKYDARDIFIDRAGHWHLHGIPVTPERALRDTDVAFNSVHGQYGEDGTLQRILDALHVAYTGPDAFISALAFNKHKTKESVAKLGVKVAHGAVIDKNKITDLDKTAFNIFRALPHPLIVKPVIGGSSVGITKVAHFEALPFALEEAFKISPHALVEEYIAGTETAVGVIDSFRNEKVYALMPVEVAAHTVRVPGHFSPEQKNTLMNAAKTVHSGLGLSHYSRSDFIVAPRGIYFLEVNPAAGVGLTADSLFPKALRAVGARPADFLDHVVTLAKRQKNK